LKTPSLISSNDYKRIDRALKSQTFDSFQMTMGDYWIQVEVSESGDKSVWGQKYIITVRQNRKNVFSIQHFRSVEEMKRILK